MSEALLSVENEGLRREIARLNRDCEDWNGKHQLACLEIERLRAALEWYANSDNYDRWGTGGCDLGSDIENDRGERARKALAKEGK